MSETNRTPDEFAQDTPKKSVRSFDEMNTGQMVFELQGTVHEVKESIAALTRTVEKGFARFDSLERSSAEIKEVLRGLAPKLEDIAGFTKHRAPHLADKADLVALQADLRADVEKRPTRRQAIMDIFLIVGLIGTLLTIGSHFAH